MAKGSEFLPFRQARKFARGLGFKNSIEYLALKKKGKYPELPSTPHYIYKDKGWINWGDFLGTGNVASFNREFLPYTKARKLVRGAKLRNNKEWLAWGRTKRPTDVPLFPNQIYGDSGWQGWADWLGPHYRDPKNRYLPLNKARAFARKNNIESMMQWKEYLTKHKNVDFPKSPNVFYKNKGWVSWPDLLGTRTFSSSRELWSYTKARSQVRKLGIKTSKEYRAYIKKHRPEKIPSFPNLYYAGNGWVDWYDWLGKKKGAWKNK